MGVPRPEDHGIGKAEWSMGGKSCDVCPGDTGVISPRTLKGNRGAIVYACVIQQFMKGLKSMTAVTRKPAEAAAPRMGPLAKLPVFLDLAGKRAILVGGGAAAAWKAELLTAAGADLHLYATELCDELAGLIETGPVAGRIVHHARPWSLDIFSGAAVAFADAHDNADAQAFYCAARAAGVPVNVIDNPRFCQFQTGAIVNRSPLVVAISTDGAAPILGQAIRRRIETLLPPSLAIWARLAKVVRGPMMARLPKGPLRRAFWERFADRAFGVAPTATEEAKLHALVETLATGVGHVKGRVSLVGAGPGDAGYLTLNAVRALQSADVILVDDLVSPEVVELGRREAQRIVVGKRGGRASCSQADINALLVNLAKDGKYIVRLKSGDPMIFGRAGEEIEQLREAGIEVDIIPGITSAAAMATILGVSLTHRDHAQSLRLVTGHGKTGGLPEQLDWRGLADPSSTLVFYMGARTAPDIARRLIAEHLSPSTPAVVMTAISRPEETRWTGTLRDLENHPVTRDRSQPALIGIGHVFGPLSVQSTAHNAATQQRVTAPTD
jgi:uroporphyrin-III C-methyltransferase / precorrin-2 dehydrogenase / sirohydrochlorin ferrochelatase